jgi:anti-anti-sigma factor
LYNWRQDFQQINYEEKPMSDLTVHVEGKGNATVVAVSGRVDSITAATLDSELGKIVRVDKRIVLDLKNVSYLSSAGVRAIVRAMQTAQKSGGGVKLASIPSHVEEVLQTVGMMQVFQSYPSVDEAAASF